MMLVLLLIILYAFDVHNVIRAKMKVGIAQQAASMAGAHWQKESLNLIGEINLVKASALLLEGSENWKHPLPDREKDEEAWRKAMQARVDLLTEMQTRVSFIGPLIGFAAAQQAAKSNGLNSMGKALDKYLELLDVDDRYLPDNGGAPKYINHYDWREPYKDLVSRINDSGIAVYPNARAAGGPNVDPPELAKANFYEWIMNCAASVAANDPPKKHHWGQYGSILRRLDDPDYKKKWWQIDYQESRFPNESEIFTLGVEFDGDQYTEALPYFNSLNSSLQNYPDQESLPSDMKWCSYDDWWFPEIYRSKYSGYAAKYDFWFKGQVLRDEVKPQYIYEGPAAYTEGYADVPSIVTVRPTTRSVLKEQGKVLIRKETSVSRVGTRRGGANDSDLSTSYRPGSIAKVLGELADQNPPIAVDIILPVFDKVSPMPTTMPIPYGFQVLKPGYSNLEKFLSWLAKQEDLEGTPPEGTEHFLQALRYLAYGVKARDGAPGQRGKVDLECNSRVAGTALRYYGYNHKFNKSAFEAEFKERLYDWPGVRDTRCFQQTEVGLKGPGWLQEPCQFFSSPRLQMLLRYELLEPGENYSGKTVEKEGKKYKVIQGLGIIRRDKLHTMDLATHKMEIPDQFRPGKMATRVYIDAKKGAGSYFVIDGNGQIVTNGQPDPTLFYNDVPGGGGSGHMGSYQGQMGSGPDTQQGVPIL